MCDVVSTMLTIATLMYGDDLVLMRCDRAELEQMLQVFDSVCSRMGMSSQDRANGCVSRWC